MAIEQLNGARLIQGDRVDSYRAVFKNRSDLDVSHPLAASGFQAVGYTTMLVAKTDITLPDNGANVITATLTPIDADTAQIDLLPSATSGVDFGTLTELSYTWAIQISDGADRIYTLATGTFTLLRDIAITP